MLNGIIFIAHLKRGSTVCTGRYTTTMMKEPGSVVLWIFSDIMQLLNYKEGQTANNGLSLLLVTLLGNIALYDNYALSLEI